MTCPCAHCDPSFSCFSEPSQCRKQQPHHETCESDGLIWWCDPDVCPRWTDPTQGNDHP